MCVLFTNSEMKKKEHIKKGIYSFFLPQISMHLCTFKIHVLTKINNHRYSSTASSAMLHFCSRSIFLPIYRNKNKTLGAKSGLYEVWGNICAPKLSYNS